MMTPTNDLIWPKMYEQYIESQRLIGKKYVEDLFRGLRFALGLPLN